MLRIPDMSSRRPAARVGVRYASTRIDAASSNVGPPLFPSSSPSLTKRYAASMMRHASFVVCRLSFVVCRLPFAVCRLPLA
ncbi:hypothetical protein, partial [Burkholderia pseudomallei]|uniref:hypothetical protein n=1 Tax=Burkholderia pseudomallei TaxID=28450 RepID=UPI0038B2E692